MKIFQEKTDDNHGLRAVDLIEELRQYGIEVERKSLYSDIEALQIFGLDINKIQKNRTFYYYMGQRELEFAELKLLVDAVQSSKFITVKKSRQLIKKLEHLVSIHDAKKLHRQVYVQSRVKTRNEQIFYNVDKVYNAIDENRMIQFQYCQWNLQKEMELRHNGTYYRISPWGLVWDNENYYLIGYDSSSQKIKHFRVDKMRNIRMMEQKREGENVFRQVDVSKYTNMHFGMFSGQEQTVELLCQNQSIGIIMDRFGTETRLCKVDEEHFRATINVVVSNNFLGWLIGLGDDIKIVGPENVLQMMQERVQSLMEMYGRNPHKRLELLFDISEASCYPLKQSADRILVHEGGHHRGCLSRVPFLCIRKVLETWCDANENCEAILGGQNAGFALFYWRPIRQKGVRT